MNKIKEFFARDPHFTVVLALTVTTVAVLIGVLGDSFLSINNLQSMATQVSDFGLLALGMGLAMLLGGIDLSVVAAAILAGLMGAKFLAGDIIPITETNHLTVMGLGILAMIVTGALCGLLNGLLISKVSIPPILATLATLIFFGGVSMALTSGRAVPNTIPEFAKIGVVTVANVPLIFIIMLVMYALTGFMLSKTRLGRRVYLYGENPVALRFVGAKHERVVLLTFILIGVVVGLAGMIMVSRVNSVRVGYGDSYLLQAILVVVLAGFDPYGGRGRISSLLLGLVLLQSLQSAFTIMRFDPYMKTFIWGASLLVIMAINFLLTKRKARRQVEVAVAEADEEAEDELVEVGSSAATPGSREPR